ncbi:MAG: helix-turn-helix transcriptional regulator [Clostridia bacterium]|nr:helix-turn-helix transcriptional regulator [Clostridia bacterium]
MKTLGDNLKELRKLNKISQKDFAYKIGTTQQRVSEWECNKIEPSLYNIVKILKIYQIDFEELIEGIDFPK